MWWQRDLTLSTQTTPRDLFAAPALPSRASHDDDHHHKSNADFVSFCGADQANNNMCTKDQGADYAESDYRNNVKEGKSNSSRVQNIENDDDKDHIAIDKNSNASKVDDDSTSEGHYYSAQEDQGDELHHRDQVGKNEPGKDSNNKNERQPQRVAPNDSMDWMDCFFENCIQDYVALAQDLVEKSKSDECKRMMLESMAHRILQEMLLVETTNYTSRDYYGHSATSSNNNDDNNDVTFSSPYRGKYHAEQGEFVFDIFKDLLDPNSSPAARDKRDALFGNILGERMVLACPEINKLGMLFSPQWRLTYEIPDEVLLCCIDARKLERADPPSLRNVVEEFDLWQLLLVLLDDWGLDTADWFEDLFTRVKEDGWKSSSKTDLQCLLFVCRTYRNTQALKWTNIRGSLARKVTRCLEILQKSSKKKSEETPRVCCVEPLRTVQTEKRELAHSKSSLQDTYHGLEESLETIEAKFASLPTDAMMKLPVEKLCVKTGKLLQTFDTAEAARRSVTGPNASRARDFKYVILGNTTARPGRPHIYHGYFWRLQGSKERPDTAVINHPEPHGTKSSSCYSPAASAICKDTDSGEHVQETQPRHDSVASRMDVSPESDSKNTIESRYHSVATDVIMQMPVEKICPNTGKILQTFDTALKAQRTVTTTGHPKMFKYVILGNTRARPGRPHIYHGYFWRLKGSKKKPQVEPSMDSTSSYTLPCDESPCTDERVDYSIPCIATIPSPQDGGWRNKTISVTLTFDNKIGTNANECRPLRSTISQHDERISLGGESVDQKQYIREPFMEPSTLLKNISDDGSSLKNGTKRNGKSDSEQTPTKRPRKDSNLSEELASDSSRMIDSDYTRSGSTSSASNSYVYDSEQAWNLNYSTNVTSPGSCYEEVII